ncbi:MAG: preprotein translocase subunit SecE [Candidatus Pacebacteria bacterium]|nr:preprotein translocase subunit SecE [Candidatus Paceibacterota bacterium]
MNIVKEIKKYIIEVKTEAKKVSWPSRKKAIKDSLVVIGISLVTAAFLGGIDYALNVMVENIIVV